MKPQGDHRAAPWSGKQRVWRIAAVAFVSLAMTGPPPQQDVLAIRDVTVITATGTGALEHATVLIRGDRIVAVGPLDRIAVPSGARVIDGTGRTLMPGLIEMHAHVSKARASALSLFVANGVTTVRDLGGDHQELLRWRAQVRSGVRLGPRLLIAGPYLESVDNIERMRRDPPESRVEPFERARIGVGSPERARQVVDSLAELEVDFLKIRTVQNRETYLALNRAANARGLKLVGHVTGIPPQLVIEAGQDGIEHWFYPTLDSLSRAARMDLWRGLARNGIAVVPTLVVMEESVLAPVERLRTVVDDSLGKVEPRRRHVARFLVADWREQLLEVADRTQRALLQQAYDSTLRNLREMHEAGVPVLAGTDVGVLNIFPGSSLHDEMILSVERLGMTAEQAIERATRMPAEFLGISDSVGTVQAGRSADLLLLDANPLEDIRNVKRIAAVVLRGRPFERTDLNRVLAAVDTALDLRVIDWKRE